MRETSLSKIEVILDIIHAAKNSPALKYAGEFDSAEKAILRMEEAENEAVMAAQEVRNTSPGLFNAAVAIVAAKQAEARATALSLRSQKKAIGKTLAI